jgi:hypothetical protein
MTRLLIRFRVLLVIAALASAGTVGWSRSTSGREAKRSAQAPRPSRGALQDLRGLDELKALFNRDAGKVRLVLLLSPT